jgi:type 1 glutamine amidotransferase
MNNIIIYTKCGDGYVHENIPYSVEMLKEILRCNLVITRDPNIFNDEKLLDTNLIVFTSTNNDIFDTDEQRLSFRRYIESGGGVVGIHSVIGTERNWKWFKQMIGMSFVWHAKIQKIKNIVIKPEHPSMKDVPLVWEIEDECYFGKELFPGIEVLMVHDLSVLNKDEKNLIDEHSGTYTDFYPSTWYHNYQGGHVWVTSLGHNNEIYQDSLFKSHILNGINFILDKVERNNNSFSTSKDSPLRYGGVNKSYWSSSFESPYGPTDDDVIFFNENKIVGKTLLLGCTKKLIPFTDSQMDNDPWYDGPNVIIKDWLDNTDYYENIFGDGILNLTKELEEGILQMVSKNCKVFICRCFNRRLEKHRIASNFPSIEEFSITPTESKIFDDYSIHIWRFQTN